MKKSAFCLIVFIFLCSSAGALPILDSVYDNVKGQALSSLKQTFNRPIKIKSASGIIIGQIVLNDVEIGKELYFKKFIIEFNPIKYAANRGDIMPSITKIKLSGGNVYVKRQLTGKVDIADILKQGEGGGPPFTGKISFEKLNIMYSDSLGMPYKKGPFGLSLFNAKGNADLRKFPAVKIYAEAKTKEKSTIKVQGKVDADRFTYDLKVSGKKISFINAANPFVPFFYLKSGEMDLNLSLSNEAITLDIAGQAENSKIKAKGRVFKDLDIVLSLENIEAKDALKAFPAIKELDAAGKIDADIQIQGNYSKPVIDSKINIRNGKLYGIPLNASSKVLFSSSILSFDDARIGAYGGQILGAGTINFSKSKPIIDFNCDISNFNIQELTYKTNVAQGNLSGALSVNGDLNNLKIRSSGSLSSASLWGQPLKTYYADVLYSDGAIKFNDIRFSSGQEDFYGRGEMSKEKEFNILANAKGLNLKGKSVLGDARVTINSFLGELKFKLDDQFMKAPIKNLSASGSIEISRGLLGEQEVEYGVGHISVSRGKVVAQNVYVKQGSSALYISGEAGIGSNTDLLVYGKRINLEDLKILNSFLPSELLNPKGTVDIKMSAKGLLEAVNRPEDLLKLNYRLVLAHGALQTGGVKILLATVEASLNEGRASLDNFYVKTEKSAVSGYIKTKANKYMQGRILGLVDFDDLKIETVKYGTLAGKGDLDFWLVGYQNNLTSSLKAAFNNVRLNSIKLDSIACEAQLRNKILSFSKPLVITKGSINLNLSGKAMLQDKLGDSILDLHLLLPKSNAQDVTDFGTALYLELNTLLKPIFETRVKVDPYELESGLSNAQYVVKTRDPKLFFKKWEALNKEIAQNNKPKDIKFLDKVDGQFQGDADIYGTFSNPGVDVKAEIDGGYYGKYRYDKLEALISANLREVEIQKLNLIKGIGKISAVGGFDIPKREVSIEAKSKDMPIDILKLWSRGEFDGNFAGTLRVNGPIANPQFGCWFKTSKVGIQGINYDGIEGLLNGSLKELSIESLKVKEGGKISELSGDISSDGKASLTATIEGQSLGLINLLTDEIKWIKGEAKGLLILNADKNRAILAGDLSISDAGLRIKALNGEIGQGNIKLRADKRYIVLDQFTGYFYTNPNKVSPFSFAGYHDLANNYLTLSAGNSKISLNLPNLFAGDIALKGIVLYGSTDNLTLSGEASLSDGMLYLPNPAQAPNVEPQELPLSLDLKLNVEKNVYLTAGNIDTLDLSNILLNLEMSAGSNVNISGRANGPKLFGKIFFKRGTVNIFNREFSLLDSSKQKEIYPYNGGNVSDNYAEFKGGILPKIDILSSVKVGSGTKETTVVSHITGTPLSQDREEAIKIIFEAYELDYATIPPTYRRAGYMEDDIKIMLLPDFIKSAIGLDKGKGVDANAVVADYLNSRMQTYIFRSLERELEQALGLESLTLQYNFGRDLRKALGASDMGYVETQTMGVGFVKGFFDRFYVNVKYAQMLDLQQTKQRQTINYQVTYKLTPVLSVSYYREPLSIYDLETGWSKTTLNLGVSF